MMKALAYFKECWKQFLNILFHPERLAIVLLLGLMSCQSKPEDATEPVRSSIEAKLKPVMNDPASYEFVSLVLADTVTYAENIKWWREEFENNIKYGSYRSKAEIRKFKAALAELDRIKASMGAKVNDPAAFTYHFSCRGKNAFGGKVLSQYIVHTEPKAPYAIIDMDTNRDKVSLTPGHFPGYQKFVDTYYL